MNTFTYDIPTRIYFGDGQLSHLGEELRRFASRVLLVYGGGSIKKTGLYDRIMAQLGEYGVEAVELSGVEPNPRIETVRKGLALCREHDIQAILAVGGGSSLDCGKFIAASRYYDGDPWEMVENHIQAEKCLPVITVTTMAATGSEMDPWVVISNPEKKAKLGYRTQGMYPAVSFLDPTLTYSVGKYQTACGSADIFSHAIETYFSDTGMEMTDRFLEGIMNTVVRFAPVALAKPDDYEARANILWCAEWAINGMVRNMQSQCGWSCHPLEHQLSAWYDITHGLGLAILTPRWMEAILSEKTAPRMHRLGTAVFGVDPALSHEEGARATIAALSHWLFEELGLASTLTEIGIGEEHLAEMARGAVECGLNRGYVPMDPRQAEDIYRACL